MQRTHLDSWLALIPERDEAGAITHLRLSQRGDRGWEQVRPQLISFLEQAHSDARRYFSGSLSLDSLHPFADDQPVAHYPGSLPLNTLKGYFGEAFCGVVAEALGPGDRQWTVPVFLFRLHREAEEHLSRIVFGHPLPSDIAGRTGSDFIALHLDGEGRVIATLVGEAKCREVFNITKAKEALTGLAREADMPVSLPRLRCILEELTDRDWSGTIASLAELVLTKTAPPRHDLFVWVFENPGVLKYERPRLPIDKAAEICRRATTVVEAHVPGSEEMIRDLYSSLYAAGEAADATA